ncbi:AAA family ATPase [Streptomyces sp. NPDC059851]|uniref:AAA family ATPase n=1 Tax=Streptomyces sp. NPDC059851 TaxID=3346971 RepID=UPI00365A2043
MRPVRLELNGFAGFRSPAVVDFTDADYFAFVGPTGSGKSTILDALTFALYGSAYRWGRSNAISYALAPTSNRCTVSLTFDVASQRFQVAREVRRVGQQIQQKAVSLVRFTDPTAVLIDPTGPQPEVLAGEIKELNATVEQLLGLSFEDFCQCVVLPQGDFARFLSANARDRQQILLKLLGAAHFEGIGKRAGAQAAEAAKEIEILTDQLARHADATPEAEADAQARVSSLGLLADTVDRLVPGVDVAHTRAGRARAHVEKLRTELSLLTSLRTPDGIEELQQHAEEAHEATQQAHEAADAAAQALSDATDAARSGPQRAVLEVARSRYADKAALARRRDEVIAAAEPARQELAQCEAQLRAFKGAVDAARANADAAGAHRDRVQQALAISQRHRQLLAAVRTPDGVAELAGRKALLDRRAEDAAAQLVAARDRYTRASSALAAAGDGSRLTEARRTLDQLVQVTDSLVAATGELDDAVEAAARAAGAVTEAQSRLDAATTAAEEARALDGAAQLRPQLRVGHACPVCDQNVTTLPPLQSAAPALAAAEATRVASADAHRHLLSRHSDAAETVSAGQRAVDTLTERRTLLDERLDTLLPDRPAGTGRDCPGDRIRLDELSAAHAGLTTGEQQAREALQEAETGRDCAVAAAATLQRELDRTRSDFHTLLGTLAELAPPAVDTHELTAAWAALEAWARFRGASVESDLAAAATEAATAEQVHRDAAVTLESAERAHDDAQTAQAEAFRVLTAADSEQTVLDRRLGELKTLLDQAPSADALPGLLEECCRLEAAVEAAAARASRTREAAKVALAGQRQWETRAATARSALTGARDAVAALNPPRLDADDLAAAWAALEDWAARGADDRQAEVLRAQAEARAAEHGAEQLLAELEAALRSDGLDPRELGDGPGRAARAPQVVAVAAERARAQVEAIRHRLAEAASVQDGIDTARARHHVADELARLMRANKFPQWLADSALDTLVAGASQSLRRLSGDRFDLSHHKGEFYVIDHSDADSKRSVRTLSGGETFQASLSLALALSDQLAGLGHSTKLESIFLDEGFGTLDPDSLETVADTLENLARGERMVGVITHVSGLAERIPVRFRLHRDSRTSVVTREGA